MFVLLLFSCFILLITIQIYNKLRLRYKYTKLHHICKLQLLPIKRVFSTIRIWFFSLRKAIYINEIVSIHAQIDAANTPSSRTRTPFTCLAATMATKCWTISSGSTSRTNHGVAPLPPAVHQRLATIIRPSFTNRRCSFSAVIRATFIRTRICRIKTICLSTNSRTVSGWSGSSVESEYDFVCIWLKFWHHCWYELFSYQLTE